MTKPKSKATSTYKEYAQKFNDGIAKKYGLRPIKISALPVIPKPVKHYSPAALSKFKKSPETIE